MVLTDPIADMITIIRNGLSSQKKEVIFWDSKLKTEILKILKNENFIEDFKKEKDQKNARLLVVLKYLNSRPAISSIKKISKPGRRVYIDKAHIPIVKRGQGRAILSTSKGVLANTEAKKLGVGGELIIEVW